MTTEKFKDIFVCRNEQNKSQLDKIGFYKSSSPRCFVLTHEPLECWFASREEWLNSSTIDIDPCSPEEREQVLNLLWEYSLCVEEKENTSWNEFSLNLKTLVNAVKK